MAKRQNIEAVATDESNSSKPRHRTFRIAVQLFEPSSRLPIYRVSGSADCSEYIECQQQRTIGCARNSEKRAAEFDQELVMEVWQGFGKGHIPVFFDASVGELLPALCLAADLFDGPLGEHVVCDDAFPDELDVVVCAAVDFEVHLGGLFGLLLPAPARIPVDSVEQQPLEELHVLGPCLDREHGGDISQVSGGHETEAVERELLGVLLDLGFDLEVLH